MAALLNDQLDDMTPEEIKDGLRLFMAYAKMTDLIETIQQTYIQDDREEIAQKIIEEQEDELEFDDTEC